MKQPGYAGTTTNLQFVLNIKTNLYFNQRTPQKTLLVQNFPTAKNPGIENFKLKKLF